MIAARLTLVQWLSPSFPTGSFAYSHGLEAAITRSEVIGAAGVQRWLAEALEFGTGRQDAILLANGLAGGADHATLDTLARALQVSAERLAETLEQGTAFAQTVSALTGRSLPPRCLPVAVAEAARPLGLPVDEVVSLYLHGFSSALVSVAMRFIPLGQTEGQGVLSALHPSIAGMAAQAGSWTLADLGGCALGADMAALAHETMDVRIFKS